jgi:uncharacterized membrane protein YphA (DoxX/SURF4 family)
MVNNGYEFALPLSAVTVALMMSGPGKVGLDNVIVSVLQE